MNLYVSNIESRFYVFLWLCLYVHHIVYRPAARVPQCTSPVPRGNWEVHVCTSLLRDGVLRDVALVHCGICELGLLPWADRSVRVGYSRKLMGALSSWQVRCFPCIHLFALYIFCTHSRILALLANVFCLSYDFKYSLSYLILSYLILWTIGKIHYGFLVVFLLRYATPSLYHHHAGLVTGIENIHWQIYSQ